jgi:hypothetical protein
MEDIKKRQKSWNEIERRNDGKEEEIGDLLSVDSCKTEIMLEE